MMQSKAIVATPTASRYITRLCKHWGHRFQVQFDEHAGFVDFEDAQCRLAATTAALEVTLFAPDEALTELQAVVEEHLLRFVPKGEHLVFEWQRVPSTTASETP